MYRSLSLSSTNSSAMAESHARLSLHPYVMLSDAVAAVRVFEENLAAQYGYSYLLDPDAHFANATPVQSNVTG